MNFNKDNIALGAVCGFIMPLIGYGLYYLFNFPRMDFRFFLEFTVKTNIVAPILSISLLANLPIFFLFLHYELYKSGKGVLLFTFLYGLIIVILKVFR